MQERYHLGARCLPMSSRATQLVFGCCCKLVITVETAGVSEAITRRGQVSAITRDGARVGSTSLVTVAAGVSVCIVVAVLFDTFKIGEDDVVVREVAGVGRNERAGVVVYHLGQGRV